MVPPPQGFSTGDNVSIAVRVSVGSVSVKPFVLCAVLGLLYWVTRWGAEWYLYRTGFLSTLFEIRSLRQIWRTLGSARECGEPKVERMATFWSVAISLSFALGVAAPMTFALILFGVI